MQLSKFKTVEQLAAAIRSIISLNFVGTTRLTADGFLSFGADAPLTISGGAITVTKSFHIIDTEGSAASDDLNTISGGAEGDIIILRQADSARDVTLKDATDNLQLAGDYTIETTRGTIALIYTGSHWLELSRSVNG